MEYHLEHKRNLKDPQTSRTPEKIISPRASQSVKLLDRFKSERPSLSYADLHYEITKKSDDFPPKPLGNHQKQQIGRRGTEDDELVKYMSNLPCYLERGKNLQEKTFNVGVLDWGRLEKWQNNHRQPPYRSGRYSPSSSNTSSVFSTDGSSTHSSRGPSCSPARQRGRRPTLQSHLKASPQEGYSQAVKSFGGNDRKFQNRNVAQSNTSNEQQKVLKTNQPFCKNQTLVKVEQRMIKGSGPKIIPKMETSSILETCEVTSCSKEKMKTQNVEYAKKAVKSDKLNSSVLKIIPKMETSSNFENCEVTSCSKEKTKTQNVEFAKKAVKSDKLNSVVVVQDCPETHKTVVLLLPRDIPRNSFSGVSQLSGSTTVTDQRSTEASQRSLMARSCSKEVHHAKVSSDSPHSCPLPCEVDNNKHAQMKRPSSMNAQSLDFLSDASHPWPHSPKIFLSPSRGRNSEEKSTFLPTNSTVIKPSEGSDLKTGTIAAAKVRNRSPIRRFSIDMGKISRIVSSKEGSAVPQLSSAHVIAKSGSERDVASTCLDKSSGDKPNAASRARSSPLRRLLDPLLKPKAANCRHFAEPLKKESTPINKVCKSFDGQLDTSGVHSVRAKLDLKSCRSISVNDSYQNGKQGSSAVQALLRVVVKNGLPLFTFAVDNNSDILAATMRKLSTSEKDDCSCLYTFFTIREIKKKSWINKGSKGKGHDYVPNVVAQMKVADSKFSNLTRSNSTDQFSLREFVLLADQQRSGFQSNDELAAIVVKIPKETTGSSIRDGQQTDHCCTSSEIGFKECLADTRRSNSVENLQNRSLVGSQDRWSTTVILPSGVHSLPSKGEPSSLIERWISGGACDCGGWDLGCKLEILGNQNQLSKRLHPHEACSTTNRFELLSQGGENQLVFSLAPFSDGIFSVEFNPSLSLLQAFSICIAVLNSRKLSEHSELSNSFEEKTSQETIRAESDGTKGPNQVQAEVPARYVSYPPLSPVGRV